MASPEERASARMKESFRSEFGSTSLEMETRNFMSTDASGSMFHSLHLRIKVKTSSKSIMNIPHHTIDTEFLGFGLYLFFIMFEFLILGMKSGILIKTS